MDIRKFNQQYDGAKLILISDYFRYHDVHLPPKSQILSMLSIAAAT